MRESADTKSVRLVAERRIDVRYANSDPERGPVGISAIVRGDSGTYKARWTKRGHILVGECNCSAMGEKCSHLLALRRIWTGEKR